MRAVLVSSAGWLLLSAAGRLLRRVEGSSMRPTLTAGDLIVVLPGAIVQPRVGSVVVVRDPRAPARETVKRIVAVAGEHTDLVGEVGVVPEGHVAVRGDDPRASTDSRHYGAVPVRLVSGWVPGRLWPRPRRLS